MNQECMVIPLSSRVCEKGTKSCVVLHNNDNELLEYIAENSCSISFSKFIAQVNNKGLLSHAYHAKPEKGEATVYPTRLEALKVAIRNSMNGEGRVSGS